MDITILNTRLEKISETIPKDQWKYFHRNSVRNFIGYINSIKGNSDKSKVYSILENYLTYLKSNFEPHIDFNIYLFNTYLKYIVPLYQKLGFIPVPNRNVLIIFIVIVIVIFFLLLHYTISECLFCIAILSLIILIAFKLKNNKVFGFRY